MTKDIRAAAPGVPILWIDRHFLANIHYIFWKTISKFIALTATSSFFLYATIDLPDIVWFLL